MEFINNSINNIINSLISILPKSPFAPYIQNLREGALSEYMGVINWFIPFGDFINILSGWLVVISLFYIYSVIMRWVKLIGD